MRKQFKFIILILLLSHEMQKHFNIQFNFGFISYQFWNDRQKRNFLKNRILIMGLLGTPRLNTNKPIGANPFAPSSPLRSNLIPVPNFASPSDLRSRPHPHESCPPSCPQLNGQTRRLTRSVVNIYIMVKLKRILQLFYKLKIKTINTSGAPLAAMWCSSISSDK